MSPVSLYFLHGPYCNLIFLYFLNLCFVLHCLSSLTLVQVPLEQEHPSAYTVMGT